MRLNSDNFHKINANSQNRLCESKKKCRKKGRGLPIEDFEASYVHSIKENISNNLSLQ